MKTEKFQLRGNKSVCAGIFQILRGRAPAQLRGNTGLQSNLLPSDLPTKTLDARLFFIVRATSIAHLTLLHILA
jgi:hypothetical protein